MGTVLVQLLPGTHWALLHENFMGSLLFPGAKTPEPEEPISEDNNPWASEAHCEIIPSAEHKHCPLRCLFFCQGQLLDKKPKLLDSGSSARTTS